MAMATVAKRWTIDEMHALPDDGNKYEVIRGELFVTLAPTYEHSRIVAQLTRILVPYVEREGLGLVYHPRAVLRFEDSEVEPDIMVRNEAEENADYENAPVPSLIVEVFSPSTKNLDKTHKRDSYMDAGVGEYWMVDARERLITVIRKGQENAPLTDEISWNPPEVSAPLVFAIQKVFS